MKWTHKKKCEGIKRWGGGGGGGEGKGEKCYYIISSIFLPRAKPVSYCSIITQNSMSSLLSFYKTIFLFLLFFRLLHFEEKKVKKITREWRRWGKKKEEEWEMKKKESIFHVAKKLMFACLLNVYYAFKHILLSISSHSSLTLRWG